MPDSKKVTVNVSKIESAVLKKIHSEIAASKTPSAERVHSEFDTHIKGVCDIHGKGSHIKGAGPNKLE